MSGIIEQLDRKPRNAKSNPDQVALSIRIAGVKPVAGYPSLIRAEDTSTISVIARRSQLGDGRAEGRPVTIPIRVSGPDQCFAHPDWTLADGSPMCGTN